MKIFLTGGSSGIGACILQKFGPDHEISAPGRAELNLNHMPALDLADFDCMILCAGSDLGGKKPFADMPDSDWHNTLQVNLISNLKLIKDYIRVRSDRWSKILVFGSTASDHIWPNMIPYSISKLALEQACVALRSEIPKTLGIAIIKPGLVKTQFNFNRHQGSQTEAEALAWYHTQPHLMPEDLMPCIENILSDALHNIKEITISP
jgi:NADP-dependent 3-hydroxy acid dehydrogenase YdfG